MTLDGTVYYYLLNIQGDVMGFTDSTGSLLISYTYEAYGSAYFSSYSSTQASLLSRVNPLTYRGYVFDIGTNLYYLQSRYYDPSLGRFINADGQFSDIGGDLIGNNIFAYCFNNPINLDDSAGAWPKWATITLGVVAAVAAIALTVVTYGAAAPAAACTLTMIGTSIGASYAVAHTVATVAVVATVAAAAVYAGDAAYTAVTGSSPLKAAVGEDLYNAGATLTTVATAGFTQAAAYSPGVCFVAGTLVTTEEGYKAIEEVTVGDKVWATDPDTGKFELKEVVQTFINSTTELIYIYVNCEEIITTPEHPFYVQGKGWVPAASLQVNDLLVRLNGISLSIEKIAYERLEIPIAVYNFEVADFHTYHVSSCDVLVHNTCGSTVTNSQSKTRATALGYSKVKNVTSHGQAVYYNPKAPIGLRYITADVDSHIGGVWKAASSISDLTSKQTRTGTFNWDLSVRLGD